MRSSHKSFVILGAGLRIPYLNSVETSHLLHMQSNMDRFTVTCMLYIRTVALCWLTHGIHIKEILHYILYFVTRRRN